MSKEILKIDIEKFDKKIEEIENQIKPLHQEVSKLIGEQNKVIDEKMKFIFENKLYMLFPLSNEYFGKEVDHITFMFKDGTTEGYYQDEILEINDNGYPHYSSYVNGILEYDENKNDFVRYFYGSSTPQGIIGFVEIEFKD